MFVRGAIAAAVVLAAVQPLYSILHAILGIVFSALMFNVWLSLVAIIVGSVGYVQYTFVRDAVPAFEVPLEGREKTTGAEPDNKKVESDTLFIESRPGMIQCFDPATMHFLGEVPVMSAEQVQEKIKLAKIAQQKWAKTTFDQRRAVVRAIEKFVMEHQTDICRISSRDTGKTDLEAILGEILTTCEKARWLCAEGEEILKPQSRSTNLLMIHKRAYVEYAPLGVLGVIAPWNYPFHNMYNHILSGIFTGNACITKVSEYTAWSSSYYTRIVQTILKEMGHDPNLVQTVTGFAETGKALVNGGVDKVIFTGSPEIGKHVMRGASATLTPTVLELGGKDPMVITEDADLSQVVQIALRGTYQNCGQNCIGVERMYVYEAVHDEFVQKVQALVSKFRQGPGLLEEVDVGATTMPSQLDLIQTLVDDAVAKGAKIVCGGKRKPNTDGLFFEPTVLTGVTHDMRIANEEVFGPVMSIIKVSGDEEMLKLVNSTDYGLGSSVFCRDTARAQRLCQGIYAGMTNVNDFGVNYLIQSLPFGGVKISGFDRFAGPEGLRGCCLLKSVVTDLVPGVRTAIPPQLQYPMRPQGVSFAQGLLNLLYADSIMGRIKGVLALCK